MSKAADEWGSKWVMDWNSDRLRLRVSRQLLKNANVTYISNYEIIVPMFVLVIFFMLSWGIIKLSSLWKQQC